MTKNQQGYTQHMDNNSISIPSFTPPGIYSRRYVAEMLNWGRQIRDEMVWQYPLLPGAIFTYQQMVSGREFQMSGKPRSVARGIEYANNAQTLLYDGTVDYGLEQFEKRRVLDYLMVGRTMFSWGDDGSPLRYHDPVSTRYDFARKLWIDAYTNETFKPDNMVVHHPMPMGVNGNFVSPISFVIPTAMMAWLIREHDRASADGRKIRDIMVVAGEQFADDIRTAVEDALKLWNGDDPTKEGVPMVFVEPAPGQKVQDMVTRIGLANIPEGFNREQFQFQYVNEIAAAMGLALRHFWQSEKATNRALEEVQEARASQKGPAAYTRSEQRLFNSRKVMRQFGDEVRFGFVEEVDIASQQTNAAVLKLYAEALKIFVESLGGVVDTGDLVAWLQREDILPADLKIIQHTTTINPETPPTPNQGKTMVNSDSMTAGIKKALEQPAVVKALDEVIDYGEITMNGQGEIIDRRVKVFSFEKALGSELIVTQAATPEVVAVTFQDAVMKGRSRLASKFKAMMIKKGIENLDEMESDVYGRIGKLEDDDYRKMRFIVEGVPILP